jgi:CDP-diacylglycerol--glycerol-3-phosphate 3-phosphatidyltransferase
MQRQICRSPLGNRRQVKTILSHPNTLTLFRIAAAPVIVILMLFPNRFCAFLAGIIFSAAAITDYLDGYFARTRGLVSNLGKVMDPVADKLLVSSAFIMLASLGWVPAWMVCIIIGREIAVTGLRNIIAGKGEDVSASNLGKYKTGFQIAAIIPLLIHYPFLGLNAHVVGTFFLWGALIFTIWSGVDYFVRHRMLLHTKA